jgi:hypothetical protein
MTERYPKLARQHITNIHQHWVGNVEPMCEAHSIPMYAYCTRVEIRMFLAIAKVLKVLVARDGIEPPTPAFSGPRSTN